jgi:transposase
VVIQKLFEFIEDRPTAYLDEMQDFLYDEFDLEVSIQTIHRILQKAHWSRKAVSARAAERSAPLRNAWIGIQKSWTADQLVFLDESAANERTGDRKFGWSPIGTACGVSRSIKRSERWSLLPALTIDGYLSYTITQGSITTEDFEAFVGEQVLPYCSPYPGPRSVLILDNASIHRSEQLQELCQEHGVLLKFLPPYSPDFNPIEATFGDIKAWIKRNHRLMEDFESFEAFLHFAVSQASGTHAGQHFREAGYIVD